MHKASGAGGGVGGEEGSGVHLLQHPAQGRTPWLAPGRYTWAAAAPCAAWLVLQHLPSDCTGGTTAGTAEMLEHRPSPVHSSNPQHANQHTISAARHLQHNATDRELCYECQFNRVR